MAGKKPAAERPVRLGRRAAVCSWASGCSLFFDRWAAVPIRLVGSFGCNGRGKAAAAAYIAERISGSARLPSELVRDGARTVVDTAGLPPSRETVSTISRSAAFGRRDWRAVALRDSPPSLPIAAICARSRLTVTPPLRPAWRASSDDHSCAVPFSWAALPPRLAISFCRSGSIDAKPRLLFPVITPPAVRKFEKVQLAQRTTIRAGFFLLRMPRHRYRAGKKALGNNGVACPIPGLTYSKHGAALSILAACPSPCASSERPPPARPSTAQSALWPFIARAKPCSSTAARELRGK